VALAGAVLATVTLVPLTLLPPDTPVVVVEIGLFLLGVANAMSVVPTSTAAYVTLPPAKVPDAVTQINILLRLGGAVGAAAVVTVLGDRSQPADQLFAGFQRAGWCLVLFAALSVLSALVLAAAARRDPSPAGGPS
jgi:disulfide bond formation protein DsbB